MFALIRKDYLLMRRYNLGYQVDGWQAMDLRVSTSTIGVANLAVPLTRAAGIDGDEPLQEPQLRPWYPSDEPPIEYPVTPPSGPGGPGS
jgi:hypothetical protein